MTREIKFRVLEGKVGGGIIEYMMWGDGFWIYSEDNGDNWYSKSKHAYGRPLMQFTGLKDKNGVEIYPKDIVKNQNGIVYLIEDWFEGADSLSAIQSGIMTVEIIGDIYSNPELLK